MKKTIIMEFSKSTKGTHVYANSEADSPVSTIYIKRSELPPEPPVNITLTIDFEDESNND
jgi:hypothetical protein